MQCQLPVSSLELAMDRRRAAAAELDHGDDDPDELGVFAAERYFYGDDALWCGRSSSSLSSSAFRTGTLEHDRSVVPTPTVATSSSEASWNSRSALLPRNEPPPAAKLGAPATPVAEADPVVPVGAESERTGRRRAYSSSSNLRRWLLGVAGCACGGGGDGEESVSADEAEASSDVLGVGGKKCDTTVASDLSPWTEMVPEQAFEEPTAVTVRAGSGRWLLGGDGVLARREAFPPIEIAGHGHRRSANSGEMAMPVVFHPAATSASDEQRRRHTKSFEKFRPLSDDRGSALGSATQSSGITIVAGNAHAPSRAAVGGGGSPGAAEDDDAAPSEHGCAYPPSEASVVWSVVTADGAASGNFSSAASGYYNYHYFSGCGEDAAAKGGDRRRRSGTATSLLACMSDKAVDAVGPVHRPEVETAAMARLGAAGGSRNGRGGGFQHDVMRRRVGK